MDYRLPIAIGLGLVYALWLAWSELKNPECSEKQLNSFALRAFAIGASILAFMVFIHTGHIPILDILAAKVESIKIQGVIAFAYACLTSSLILWLASSLAKK